MGENGARSLSQATTEATRSQSKQVSEENSDSPVVTFGK